ncbi:MAG: polar amino acid ABC transporter substrate-binding protein, partial [Marinobacter sp.]
MIILALWTLSAASQSLRIMGADDGFLPFYYGKDLNKGIFVEAMNEFASKTGISAEFRVMARKRQAWALGEGLANAVFANPRWMPAPE